MSGPRFIPVLLLVAILLFAGLAVFMRVLEDRALRGDDLRDQLTPAGGVRPLAEVAEKLRQSKLVTVEVRTTVASTSKHVSWRGDVAANVEVPVRLLYGTDLSKLDVHGLAYSPAAKAYLVRIPPPQRVASEIYGSDEEIAVQLGWLRLRKVAGEYHLGLARRELSDRARELALSPEDARFVRQATLEQVEALVRSIVGERAQVQVVYSEQGGA